MAALPPATDEHFLLRQQAQSCVLELRGAIDASTVRRIEAPLRSVERLDCARKVLLLRAEDGIVGDAITLGAMIRNRGYTTQVAPGGACRTPCALVFAAGIERWLPAEPQPARLVWTLIPPDADFGHRQCEAELSRAQQVTLMRYLRAMLPPQAALTAYQNLQAADCRSAVTTDPAQALASGLATTIR